MKTAAYNFKQAELYTICRFILETISTPELLSRFGTFKAKYTTGYITTRQAEVDAAEDIPDEENRNAVHEVKRVQLLALNTNALRLFNLLERYIAEVVPPAEQKANLEAAGSTFYSDAADADFDSTIQLLNNMVNYTTANQSLLEQGGLNMPATFLPSVQTLQADFEKLYEEFLGSEAGAEVTTESKITLNNDLFNNIIRSINADAQALFVAPDEEALRKLFTVEHQLYLVRGAGVAGIRFAVSDAATNLPIMGATAAIPAQGYTATTDEQGRVIKLQLAAGSYVVEVSKAGYNTYTASVEVEVGTVKRLDVKLTAL